MANDLFNKTSSKSGKQNASLVELALVCHLKISFNNNCLYCTLKLPLVKSFSVSLLTPTA